MPYIESVLLQKMLGLQMLILTSVSTEGETVNQKCHETQRHYIS